MMLHDQIKIEYVRQGYLPNYPYHLISDKEMFDAFLMYQASIARGDAVDFKINGQSVWSVPENAVTAYGLSRLYEKTTDYIIFNGDRASLARLIHDMNSSATLTVSDECYFATMYPMHFSSLTDAYFELVDALSYHITSYLQTNSTSNPVSLPDWVYSYMICSTVSSESDIRDRHDLLVLLGEDNVDDELTESAMQKCYEISKAWIAKLPAVSMDTRWQWVQKLNPVQQNLIVSWISESTEKTTFEAMQLMLSNPSQWLQSLSPSRKKAVESWVAALPLTPLNDHRPPTMFGEPHVIKSLRINALVP